MHSLVVHVEVLLGLPDRDEDLMWRSSNQSSLRIPWGSGRCATSTHSLARSD